MIRWIQESGPSRAHALEEHADVGAELPFGRAADSPPRAPHRWSPRIVSIALSEHLSIEAELVAEVIVHRGDVGAGVGADLADGDVLEAARGKELRRGGRADGRAFRGPARPS